MAGAVQGHADEVTAGAWLLDAHGKRREVKSVKRLRGGFVKIVRVDGYESRFSASEGVTFVPYDGRVTRPACEMSVGAVYIFPDGDKIDITSRRQVMKADGHITFEIVGGYVVTFGITEMVTFIPAPARRAIVGRGATLHLHMDKMPYVVVSVSPTGAYVVLAPLKDIHDVMRFPAAGECNGYPVLDHVYTAEEVAACSYSPNSVGQLKATRRWNGGYMNGTCGVTFDEARLFRNYAE